ncbi:c-type cytochrome [Atopomonas hussainii]|uniref:c-type cytochrome n=1 Tax=Atopomonas hussainii TaxID=1429083 RepID=UPI0009001F4D|nr:c-type cytochrome [Atopomonas hussainii]
MRVLVIGVLLGWLSPTLAGQPLTEYQPPLDEGLRARLQAADSRAGEAFFARKCAQCHDAAADGIDFTGPLLWNVVNRPIAAREGFNYSAAMRAINGRWDLATLDYYLADTKRAIPGRSMNFGGISDAELRASVLLYLRSLSDAPEPLP